MKKVLSIVMPLILILSFSMTALAYSNTEGFGVTLNHIGDAQGNLYYTSFPQTISLEGIATYPTEYDKDGNAIHVDNQTIQLDTYVGTVVPAFDDKGKFTNSELFTTLSEDKVKRNDVSTSSFTFAFPWTITEANTYYIVMTAKKANAYADDYQLVNVVSQITATHPAAPAVAADLLKKAGIEPRYGSGKKGGNYIADVADHMGPTTLFDGVAKSDVSAYRTKVAEFLNKQLAINGGGKVTP